MPDLLTDYECIESQVKRRKYLRKVSNYDMLIIDEWLGSTVTGSQFSFLFKLVEKRNEIKPTVFFSQFNPKDWYVRLGESTMCESLLNRILSGLCRLDCGEFNIREYCSKSKLKIQWCSIRFRHRCHSVLHRCVYERIFRQSGNG